MLKIFSLNNNLYMKYRKILLSALFMLGSFFSSNAQSLYAGITCPPNIDFELGNLSYWQFFRGTVALGPVYSVTACPPAFSLHTLMAGTGLDYYGSFPVVDPGGGFYALRLGKDTDMHYAVRAQYFIDIPPGINNYSLIYRYAVVLEDGGHNQFNQPSFEAIAFDSATGKGVPCGQDTFYVGNPLHPLSKSPVNSRLGNGLDVDYLSWQTVSVNLSGLSGHTVGIEFTTAGCTYMIHFGYGYIDMTCGLFAIDAKICDDTLATLTGPAGFEYYAWYDSIGMFAGHLPIGSTQTITLPIPDSATTFAVVVEPFAGFGCPDTLYTRVLPSYLHTHPSNDTLVCAGTPIIIQTGATDSALDLPLKYSWTPAISISCTNCPAPIVSPTATTTYYAVVTDKAGCSKRDTIVVKADNVTSTITKVNDSCYGFNNGSATVVPVTGIAPYNYSWNSIPVQTGVTATGLTARTYTVNITDNLGCKEEGVTVITQPPANNLSILSSAGPTTCLGNQGYIILSGLVSGTTYTISYTFNGVPATQTSKAGGAGVDTLKNLLAGIYDHITVVTSLMPRPRCPFNTVGPLTLNDPAPPPLPAVGNNGPVCLGDTLKVSATDAVSGVTYAWSGPGGFGLIDTNSFVIPVSKFSDAGTYTVTVTKALCTSSNTTLVVVKQIPTPVAGNNSAICTGDTLKLNSFSGNGATSYRWAGPNNYSSILQNPIILRPDTFAAGTYTVTITLDGCAKIDSTKAIIYQTPGPPIVTDTVYCQGDIAAPLNTTGVPGNNLAWYTSSKFANPTNVDPVPFTTIPGTYKWYSNQALIATPTLSCVGPLAVQQVTVHPKFTPQVSASDSVICTGSQVTFTVSNAGDDKTGISWAFAAGDSVKNLNPLVHAFDAIGTYTISATALHQYCPNPTLTKVINVYPYPVINLGPDTSICLGSQSITLVDAISGSRAAAQYVWNTGEITPSIVVRKPGIYYAKLTMFGCSTTDTVIVANNCYMDIPNAFTPNGDGANDYFFPRQLLTRGLIGFGMDIYNRWGQKVFSTIALDGQGWDGNFNGVPQPEGVYVYIITGIFKDGQKENHTGNVTLLR
jgi:gliding motility-associated-like protein